VIEAALEQLDLKREIFGSLDEIGPPHALLTEVAGSLCDPSGKSLPRRSPARRTSSAAAWTTASSNIATSAGA
jgi:hypothetical protein